MTEAVSYINKFLCCCFCVPSQVFPSFDSPRKRLFICTLLESCLCIKQKNYLHIQLFRERLSEKVHATILKGIVGGFKFTVLYRNLKELVRKAVEMCLQVLKESNKRRFDRYSRQKQCIDHIPYYLSELLCAHFSDNLSRNSCNCYVCKDV